MKVAALILHYECTDLTREAVRCVTLGGGCDVFVVDNGSSSPYKPAQRETVLRLDANHLVTGGFNKGMGLLAGKGYDAYWQLNNDITFQGDVLGSLVSRLEAIPTAAVVSPAIVGNHHLQMRPRRDEALCRVAWLDWVAPLVRASAWASVGPFDTNLPGYGMDMDWCWRAVLKGWLALVDHGVVIEHLSGATRKRTGGHGIDRGEIMTAVLKGKWGDDWQAKLNRAEAVPWTK